MAIFSTVLSTDTEVFIGLHSKYGPNLTLVIHWSEVAARVMFEEYDNTRFKIPAGYSLRDEPAKSQ